MNASKVTFQILSLEEAGKVLTQFPGYVDHLVSLGRDRSPLPEGWENIPPDAKLRMVFEDVEDPQSLWDPPKREHVQKLLRFLQTRGASGHWVFHCRMGISRSAACAAVVLAAAFPGVQPREIFKRILEARPQADPNTLIVAYADEILGYEGALLEGALSYRLQR